MKTLNYFQLTVGEAYQAYKDEGLSVECDADSLTINLSEEDEESDC